MHLSDALISPTVAGSMYAVSGVLLAVSVHEIKKDFNESRIPLMGVSGAFIFAAQMLNFSIPGTGSSGHISGAVLLSALFGAGPAFVILAGILLIQALFFADGGLLAYGCNLFNMGFFGAFLAGPYLFKPIAGRDFRKGRVIVAGILSGIAANLCGAFAVTLQTLLSGVTQLPFAIFLSFMLPIHAVIGFAEGLATTCVVLFVRKNLPQMKSPECAPGKHPFLRAVCVFSIAAIVMAGGLSIYASSKPDGLEWSVAETAASAHQQDPLDTATDTTDGRALFADYMVPGLNGEYSGALAGLIGCALCVVATILVFRVISRWRKQPFTQERPHV